MGTERHRGTGGGVRKWSSNLSYFAASDNTHTYIQKKIKNKLIAPILFLEKGGWCDREEK